MALLTRNRVILLVTSIIIGLGIYFALLKKNEGFTIREQLVEPLQRRIEMLRDRQATEVADIADKERRLAELEEIRDEMENNAFLSQRVKARILSDRLTAEEMFFQARPDRFFRLETLRPFQQRI